MNREEEFNEQLAREVAQNKDAIADILRKSEVGQCGGRCKGYQEKSIEDLCEQCFNALEDNADEIFSASPMLKLFGDAMNSSRD
ncbi:MAG: hypothetical protein ACLQF0_01410 [Dissulfurispiraceae bacterium]